MQEDFKQFAERQGCNHVVTRTGFDPRVAGREAPTRIVWENGAWADGSGRYEPPEDERERQTLQLEYYRVKVAKEAAAWLKFKAEVQQQATWAADPRMAASIPPVPRETLQRVRTWAKDIEAWTRERNRLEELLADGKAERKEREEINQALQRQRQADQASIAQDIQNISITLDALRQ